MVNFSPFCLLKDYELQTAIDEHRVTMASDTMIFFGLEPGKYVRWMAGKYMGSRKNVSATLTALYSHVSKSDYDHIQRILTQGCPAKLHFDEPSTNKLAIVRRGNQKSFTD